MKKIRSRIVSLTFFCLISLGQAYPFSVALAMSPKAPHSCCCSGVVKPCDCDHSGRGQKKKAFRCHEDKRAGYAPTPCGGSSHNQAVNFTPEPFVPVLTTIALYSPVSVGLPEILQPRTFFDPVPEAPPPKA